MRIVAGDPHAINNAPLGFFSAINWGEPFVLALLGFHVCVYGSLYFARRRPLFKPCLFFTLACLTLLSRRINEFGAGHWQQFCTQDYFDRNGVFMAIMFSGPLLVAQLITVVRRLEPYVNKFTDVLA